LLQQKRANAHNIYLKKSQLKIKGLAHCITFVSSSSRKGEELLNSDRVKSQWGGSERIKRGGSQKPKAKKAIAAASAKKAKNPAPDVSSFPFIDLALNIIMPTFWQLLEFMFLLNLVVKTEQALNHFLIISKVFKSDVIKKGNFSLLAVNS
jgi:hypothetical protein